MSFEKTLSTTLLHKKKQKQKTKTKTKTKTKQNKTKFNLNIFKHRYINSFHFLNGIHVTYSKISS